MQNRVVIKAKLQTLRKGDYTVYVFKSVDKVDEYVMVTKLPNWGFDHLKIGDEGFLSYDVVIAGETTWYDHKNTKDKLAYRYTGNYFVDFVSLTNEVKYDTKGNLVIEGL